MSSDYGTLWARSIARPMAERWWATAIRGAVAVLFGLAALLTPVPTLLSLVLLFAVYALADGVAELVVAARCVSSGCGWRRWAPMLVGGLASLGAAALAVLWPQITILVFVLILAAWSLISGVMMIAQAVRVGSGHGRLWLALGGVASLIFGLALVVAPLIGAVVVTWWLGAYALALGVALLAAAFRHRAMQKDPRWPPAPSAGSAAPVS
jgi:uncharacterized membrane protein HdeD (DUF308 family)